MMSNTLTEAGERLAWYLEDRFPTHRAKRLARLFGVDLRTAENWIAGMLPQNKHLFAMFSRFGPAFRDWITAPAIGSPEEVALNDEIERLEEDLRMLRLHRRVAQSRVRHRPMDRDDAQ